LYSFHLIAWRPRNRTADLTAHATAPPIGVHIAVSVGGLLKNREMSEPHGCEP